jgi:hypothetical protein
MAHCVDKMQSFYVTESGIYSYNMRATRGYTSINLNPLNPAG